MPFLLPLDLFLGKAKIAERQFMRALSIGMDPIEGVCIDFSMLDVTLAMARGMDECIG